MQRQQSTRSSPWLFVLLVGAALVVVFLIVFSSNQGFERSPRRDTPPPVFDRVISALEQNNADALYREVAPSVSEVFDRQSFLQGASAQVAAQGVLDNASVQSPVTIKSDPPWNGEWAEGQVIVQRGGGGETTYIVRFHRENGGWWLYGTIPVSP